MGIIINDSITFNNGVTLTNCYCGIHESMIDITRNDLHNTTTKKYNVRSSYTIWANKEARTNDLTSLDRGNLTLNLDSTELEQNVNLFELLYNEIKSKYTDYTDDI
jgi:hypothetical protein